MPSEVSAQNLPSILTWEIKPKSHQESKSNYQITETTEIYKIIPQIYNQQNVVSSKTKLQEGKKSNGPLQIKKKNWERY